MVIRRQSVRSRGAWRYCGLPAFGAEGLDVVGPAVEDGSIEVILRTFGSVRTRLFS